MTNGQCPTWFVVKWLEKHPTHTAKAPETDALTAVRICSTNTCFGYEYESHGGWFTGSYPPYRSDWTIYNERGKRVRFRKRTELRKVGELGARERLTASTHTGRFPRTISSNNTVETFDILIRERSR